MQNITDIKTRKKSIVETSQITKAMELISVSKLNKITGILNSNSAYFSKVRSTIKEIILHTDKSVSHPYLNKQYGKEPAYIIISGDKGLAGDYNHKIIKKAEAELSERNGKIFAVGKIAADYFITKGYEVDVSFVDAGAKLSIDTARKITAYLLEYFTEGVFDSIKIIYTEKAGGALPEPVIMRLLPVLVEDFDDVSPSDNHAFIHNYHPSPEEVLNVLVPQYILGMVFSALLRAIMCENVERVRMMHSATINAEELIEKLNLQYNRIRQETITTELAELSSSKFSEINNME